MRGISDGGCCRSPSMVMMACPPAKCSPANNAFWWPKLRDSDRPRTRAWPGRGRHLRPGAIAAAVIDKDDLGTKIQGIQLLGERGDEHVDVAEFVERRNDDAELRRGEGIEGVARAGTTGGSSSTWKYRRSAGRRASACATGARHFARNRSARSSVAGTAVDAEPRSADSGDEAARLVTAGAAASHARL